MLDRLKNDVTESKIGNQPESFALNAIEVFKNAICSDILANCMVLLIMT